MKKPILTKINLPFLLVIILFAFVTTNISGQNEIDLLRKDYYNLEDGAYEKINKVIAATNGYIIAVGETMGKGSNYEKDGLFIIIDPENLNRVVSQRFGKPNVDDVFNSVVQNNDGTFTLVGYTSSGVGKKGSKDGWVIKTDLKGIKLSEKEAKGNPNLEEEIIDIAINPDGDKMAVGLYYDKRGKTSKNLIVQFDEKEEVIVGSLDDEELGAVEAIVADWNGHFVLMGNTSQGNREHPDDVWAIKIDKNGGDVWGKTKFFGDKNFQQGFDIAYTPVDGGFAIAGTTATDAIGGTDMWLLKIDDDGKISWGKKYRDNKGDGPDIANAVIELSEGGFAILGQTWSHMASAKHSSMFLVITDDNGVQLDSDRPTIGNGKDDKIGHDLVELFSGEDIIISGSAAHKELKDFRVGHLESYTYKKRQLPDYNQPDAEELYGNPSTALNLSSTSFSDGDGDQYMQSGERGYFTLILENKSNINLNELSGKVYNEATGELDYWDQIEVGTIRAGQSKKVHIPVKAIQNINGQARLSIDILAGERMGLSEELVFGAASDTEPARLIVENYEFIPNNRPKVGQPIRLNINITNSGGLPSKEIKASFVLPPGVNPIGGGRDKRIPKINGYSDYNLSLQFRFDASYKSNNIPIAIRSSEMRSLEQTMMNLDIQQGGSSTPAQSPTAASGTEVYWITPRPGARDVTVNSREVNVSAMAISNKTMSKNQFDVFVNSKKSQGQRGLGEVTLEAPKQMGNERVSQVYQRKIRLKEGRNVVQIVCYDESGNVEEGKSQTITFNYIPQDKPNLYVVSIGVEHDDLDYTAKDARDFINYYNKLKGDKNLFGSVEAISLTKPDETTAYNLKAAFIDYSNRKFKDNDLIVIFLSSHGEINDQGDFILLPSDYDNRYKDLSSINFKEDILRKLRVIDGKKLIFIDACHSGKLDSRSRRDKSRSIMLKSLIESTSGVEIFASCRDEELSYEDESWQNGAFTEAILEAFENKKVQVDGEMIQADIYRDDLEGGSVKGSDGVLSIEELKTFLERRVPYLVRTVKNESQHPINKQAERLPGNLGIYVIEE